MNKFQAKNKILVRVLDNTLKRKKPPRDNPSFSYLSRVNSATEHPYRLDFLFGLILDAAKKLIGVSSGFFMLLDEKTKQLYIKTARGLSEKAVRETKVRLGEGIIGEVAESGEPFMSGDVSKDKKTAEFLKKLYRTDKTKAFLCIPIKLRDKIMGVMAATRGLNKGIFTQKHKEILLLLATYASQAIEKNELYREIDYILAKLQVIQTKYGHYEGR